MEPLWGRVLASDLPTGEGMDMQIRTVIIWMWKHYYDVSILYI